jgi:tetraacyldisaccharide 4'-kinase
MEFEDRMEETSAGPLALQAAELWRVRRKLHLQEAPTRAVAFCGIARPSQFFAGLDDLGVEIVETVRFSDHHRYTEKDIAQLIDLKSHFAAGGFLTTEKDLINLGSLAARLQPLHTAELVLSLEDPSFALSTLFATLERRSGCRF